MPHFAAALYRRPTGWGGEELELKGVEDLDGVVDELRQYGDDADVQLLFVEEDDEWFAVVRVDEDGDPRVFLSDARAMESSDLGALIGEAATVAEPREELHLVEDDEDDDEDAVQTGGDPVGDADLLTDLGTTARKLLELSAEEGQLPADVISSLCERAGCLEALESLRLA